MPDFRGRTGLASYLVVLSLLLAGCGGTGDSRELGDWTLKTDVLRLTKDLQVSETKAFYFGTISDLAVTPEGRMLIADREAKNIKILAPDGSLVDTLGGPGEGPGEFQSLMNVQVARGDFLYAYDFRRSRLTVFAPDAPYTVARTVSIPRDRGFGLRLLVLDNRFVTSLGSGFRSPEEGVQTPPPRTWRFVNEDGTLADTLLQTRRGQFATASIGDGFRVRTVPFTRATKFALGPDDRLYTGWSDSLRIQAHTVDGSSETVVDVLTPPVPVTEAERDSVLNEVSEDLRSIISSAIPETKPAFTDFAVAEDGRLWVRRPASGKSAETVAWWILDPRIRRRSTRCDCPERL